MAVDERRRSELFQAAAQALGQEHAVTMFELLPPPASDIATQQAMDERFDAIDGRFDAIDGRFETIDGRFEATDGRFEAIERRFEAIDRRFEEQDRRFASIDQRFDVVESQLRDLRNDLTELFRSELAAVRSEITANDERIDRARDNAIAVSRAELLAAVSGQTRALAMTLLMAILGMGGLAITFSRLF